VQGTSAHVHRAAHGRHTLPLFLFYESTTDMVTIMGAIQALHTGPDRASYATDYKPIVTTCISVGLVTAYNLGVYDLTTFIEVRH